MMINLVIVFIFIVNLREKNKKSDKQISCRYLKYLQYYAINFLQNY
jgi:hypothetical protein